MSRTGHKLSDIMNEGIALMSRIDRMSPGELDQLKAELPDPLRSVAKRGDMSDPFIRISLMEMLRRRDREANASSQNHAAAESPVTAGSAEATVHPGWIPPGWKMCQAPAQKWALLTILNGCRGGVKADSVTLHDSEEQAIQAGADFLLAKGLARLVPSDLVLIATRGKAADSGPLPDFVYVDSERVVYETARSLVATFHGTGQLGEFLCVKPIAAAGSGVAEAG